MNQKFSLIKFHLPYNVFIIFRSKKFTAFCVCTSTFIERFVNLSRWLEIIGCYHSHDDSLLVTLNLNQDCTRTHTHLHTRVHTHAISENSRYYHIKLFLQTDGLSHLKQSITFTNLTWGVKVWWGQEGEQTYGLPYTVRVYCTFVWPSCN